MQTGPTVQKKGHSLCMSADRKRRHRRNSLAAACVHRSLVYDWSFTRVERIQSALSIELVPTSFGPFDVRPCGGHDHRPRLSVGYKCPHWSPGPAIPVGPTTYSASLSQECNVIKTFRRDHDGAYYTTMYYIYPIAPCCSALKRPYPNSFATLKPTSGKLLRSERVCPVVR
jgi:hypothetical protein